MDEKPNEPEMKEVLRQLSDILLLNGNLLSNPGLYTGEMGLVLFFARYARFTQNELYLDYAYDLMDNIQKVRLNRYSLIGYKHGLAGIGAAIEYLVQNDYFEADTDAILDDFDDRIFNKYNLPSMSLDEIIDILYYANWRLSGNSVRKDMIRRDILTKIKPVFIHHAVDMPMFQLCQRSTPDIFATQTFSKVLELIAKDDFWNKNSDVQGGLAGWGLSLLTVLDRDDSWYRLFPNDFKTLKK